MQFVSDWNNGSDEQPAAGVRLGRLRGLLHRGLAQLRGRRVELYRLHLLAALDAARDALEQDDIDVREFHALFAVIAQGENQLEKITARSVAPTA